MNPFAASPTSAMRVALIDDVRQEDAGHAGDVHEEGRRQVERLAIGLAKRGHTVDVYRARAPGDPVWEDLYAGVRVHRIADRMVWPAHDQAGLSQAVQSFAAGVRRLAMGAYPCDVVHAWGPFAGLVALRLTRGVAVPFVLNMQAYGGGHAALEGGEQLAAVRALLARRADRLIACSEAEREMLIRRHGAMRSSIHVLPCGVDTQAFRPGSKAQMRRQLGLPPEAFIVLWGHPTTGQADHARACAPFFKALQKLPAHVLVPGCAQGGESYAMFCSGERVSTLPIDAHRIDHRTMLHACYAAADLVVLPPVSLDALSLNPREAMACGTPVIAMTAHENDEVARIVKDGVTGHVLHKPRPDALLRHVQAMRDEPQRRSAMGMAAVLRARTFFTWERAAERFAAVYTDARLLSRVRQDYRSFTLIRSTPRTGGVVPFLPA